jgi:protein-S-isoprenylcysteine O-methyltransferase Ste14
MHLVFDIFQGIGVAAAVGIRPFLPALAAGALAAGDVEIHFNGTDYSFLQSAPFLLAMAVCAIVLAVVERRISSGRLETGRGLVVIAVSAAVLGALLFAGSLARGHYAAWPGWVGGVICALLAVAATRPLLTRVRSRLDRSTAGALPAYAEGAAVLTAVLSVLAPPVGLIVLLLLIWLLVAGRRRDQQKYAGLRILR